MIAGLVGCLAFLGSSTNAEGNATSAARACASYLPFWGIHVNDNKYPLFSYTLISSQLPERNDINRSSSKLDMHAYHLFMLVSCARIAIRDRPGFKDTEEAKFIRDRRGLCQPYVSDSSTALVIPRVCKDKMLTLR